MQGFKIIERPILEEILRNFTIYNYCGHLDVETWIIYAMFFLSTKGCSEIWLCLAKQFERRTLKMVYRR